MISEKWSQEPTLWYACLLVLFVLSYDIIKTIKISESHRFQLGAAQGYVGGGVVIGDMGQADGYLLRFYVGDEPVEIVDYLTIVYRSISTIDVGIHVFYIYYIMVYVWSYSQEMMDGAKAFSDTAVVVISRMAGEGHNDIPQDMSKASYVQNSEGYSDFEEGQHYLSLSRSEREISPRTYRESEYWR